MIVGKKENAKNYWEKPTFLTQCRERYCSMVDILPTLESGGFPSLTT
jgi:hypothetical protein